MRYDKEDGEKIMKSMVILYDSREHEGKNDHILNYFDRHSVQYKKKKLDYGDYSFMIPQNEELSIPRDLYFDRKIMVERKSGLDELAINFTKERDRIKKELAMAPKEKIMLIENASYGDLVTGDYRSEYNKKSFWASYHSFWHEFDIPMIFMPDKEYSGAFMLGYFGYYLRRNYIKM